MDPVVETPPVGEQAPAAEVVVEAPINAEPEVAEIAAQAKNPDAVSNAIKAERDKAKAERDARLAAEAKVKEYEDAQKSEEEKRQEALEAERSRAEAAEARAKELEHKELQREVAVAHGIPLNAAHRLVGDTKEELEADAEQFKSQVSAPAETPPPGDGGARTPVPPKDLDDQIREAEAAGDYRTSMSLKSQKLLAARQQA